MRSGHLVKIWLFLASPKDTKDLLVEYFNTLGAKFRPTRINMLFYKVGIKIRVAVAKNPNDNKDPNLNPGIVQL